MGFAPQALPFGLRFDLLWQELDDEDEWFRQIGGLANATFGIPLIFIQPYALVGGGVIRTESPDVVHVGHVHGESETTVGFNAGLGLAP